MATKIFPSALLRGYDREKGPLSLGRAVDAGAIKLQAPGDSDFTFYEVAAGRTPSLRTWFYPGDNLGLEFREVPVQSGRQHANLTTSNAGGD